MIDPAAMSFVGCYSLPLRHGMTLGEIATMANAEKSWGAKLEVVKLEGWQRGDWWDSTGLAWVNPSPNMRSLAAALLYPGIGMLEYSRNYSVGRGTETPFEHIGADWIDGRRLAAYLNGRAIPGLRVYPVKFKPESSNLVGQNVEGVRFVITQREVFSPVQLGVELASALEALHPEKIAFSANLKLIGSQALVDQLAGKAEPRAILQRLQDELAPFLERRGRFLLY